MYLLDCTLRDGANVVGRGFSKELTAMILEALIQSGITVIEYGNAGGIGAYEQSNYIAPLTDLEYLDLAQPYLAKAEIGMFLNARRYLESNVDLAAEKGQAFLRVGADAGDSDIALKPIKDIKQRGMKARYSLMKAYLLTPEELAEESRKLEDAGLDEITIMDSAGTMTPEQVAHYCACMAKALTIPFGFHGHNNLGLSTANALAACENGASVLDCGLLGMARSAGNLPTEVAVVTMQQLGKLGEIDLYSLLAFLDKDLIPAMKTYDYHVAISPLDLVLGMSGTHSNFTKLFKQVAQEQQVDLYKLIVETAKKDRKSPSKELIESIANVIR